MTYTLYILIRRDPRDSQQEFLEWWTNHHAELAKELPGLRRYVLHEITGGFEKDIEWHGLAELSFQSLGTAQRAFASEVGRRVMNDTMTKRGARLMMNSAIHRVVVPEERPRGVDTD